MVAVAGGSAWYQNFAWQRGPAKLPADDETRLHAGRQLRRRLQVSAMLALVGLLIPIGDMAPIFRRSPRLFVIYWLFVLGLVVWMVLLALGDLASSVAFHRLAQSDLEAERQALQREIDRYRSQSNGHHET